MSDGVTTTPDRLERLLRSDIRLDTLGLHVALLAACVERARVLRDLLREPAPSELAVQAEAGWNEAVGAGEDPVDTTLRLLAEADGHAASRLLTAAGALRALDRHHRERQARVERRRVTLPSALGGGIWTLLPPPAALIEERVPVERRLVRSARHFRVKPGDDLDLWWTVVRIDHGTVHPAFDELAAHVAMDLTDRLEGQGDLRIALVSPFGELRYRIRSDRSRSREPRGTPFRFVELDERDQASARAQLDEILRVCADERVDLLCFPELTLDPDLLRALSQALLVRNRTRHPALVVTGSFHLQGDRCFVNRCDVFDARGEPLWSQEKCTAFEIPAAQAAEMSAEARASLGIDDRGGHEDIRSGEVLQVVDSPIGRLVTPICLDFIGHDLRTLFTDAGINLFLVPAMTLGLTEFAARARELGTDNRASTFVVNSDWLPRRLGVDVERVLVYLPQRAKPPAPTLHQGAVRIFSIREILDRDD